MEKGYLANRLKREADKHFIGKMMTSEAAHAVDKVAEFLEPLISAAVLTSDEHGGGYDDCGCDLCDAVRDLIDT